MTSPLHQHSAGPATGQHGLLNPAWAGTAAASMTSDAAVVAALLEVEATWGEVLAEAELAPAQSADALRELSRDMAAHPDPAVLAEAATGGGNPVIPLLAEVRRLLAERGATDAALHRGATSQDVLDTALMLVVRRVIDQVVTDLLRTGEVLSRTADAHRETLAVARSLTQPALPTVFGLRAAQWLAALSDAAENLHVAAGAAPLQWGGAVGTQAALVELAGSPARAEELTARLAEKLGLALPAMPWHTRRGPVLQAASAAAEALAALGTLASDVLTLQRPEIGELREPSAPGRGGSSAMPQKQNPVLSVLIRSAALAGPGHLATLHQAAGAAVDERPDGAWHAEWPALTELLRLSGGAAARAAELCEGLQVFPAAMRQNLDAAGPGVLGERLLARLGDAHPGGPAGLKALLAEAARDESDLTVRLREKLPAETISDDELAETLDPHRYLGRSAQLIDAARARFAELRAGLSP
ncbi:lyase family protein [Nesterenkonia sp. K-15-9-6]|uniref:lyase family protein n=1 Tax=Nesterenkonia sp. K-15-9-6 TaxID=3093918 RepID=UPI004044026D